MKLALAQMLVEGGEFERNLQRAASRISSAAESGADLVLLPEALNCGWTDSSARELADNSAFDFMREQARENRIYVCAGLIEKTAESLFNSAVLIDPDGKIQLKHRKINELEIAQDLYQCGDFVANPVETEFGKLGVHICADAFADELWISRELCERGTEIILSPCAWAVEPCFTETYGEIWRDSYGPVAKEHGTWIAGCSNVGVIESGPWAGRSCIGNSIVFDPKGKEVLTGSFGVDADELLMVEVG